MDFAAQLDQQLDRLQSELKEDIYRPQPVRQVPIPKAGKPGEFRMLGIPTIYDRVCQQALLNRLEPIFEPVFDEANFGYRRGRSTKDAMRKVWKEIQSGREWIVDADLKDFFGSVDHEKLLTLVAQRIADGRVLRLIEAMLKAGSYGKGRLFPTERGTPQGGVVSPLLSNILLTPFDQEMRRKGYQLTRYADDWVVDLRVGSRGASGSGRGASDSERTGRAVASAEDADRACPARISSFSGTRSSAGSRLRLAAGQDPQWCSTRGSCMRIPREKSIRRFMDQVRSAYRSGACRYEPEELIEELNPVLRGWGQSLQAMPTSESSSTGSTAGLCGASRSHRFKRWRNGGWRQLPESQAVRRVRAGEPDSS